MRLCDFGIAYRSDQMLYDFCGSLSCQASEAVACEGHWGTCADVWSSTLLGNHMLMVMDLCPGGDLLDRLVANGPMQTAEAHRAVASLVDAVSAVHAAGYCHRDIRLENILVDSSGHVRLCDFGLASRSDQMLYDFCGSLSCQAPEAVACEGHWGTCADVWSVGMCAYALITGDLPFSEPEWGRRCLRAMCHAPRLGLCSFLSRESELTLIKTNLQKSKVDFYTDFF